MCELNKLKFTKFNKKYKEYNLLLTFKILFKTNNISELFKSKFIILNHYLLAPKKIVISFSSILTFLIFPRQVMFLISGKISKSIGSYLIK